MCPKLWFSSFTMKLDSMTEKNKELDIEFTLHSLSLP